MKQGLLGRISREPFRDWHAFGISSAGPKVDPNLDMHYMVVVGRGDFTKSLINDPPTMLWKREVLFYGAPYFFQLYRRAILLGESFHRLQRAVIDGEQ